MGVDLSLVDIGILSHGHSDHGGGLPAFLALNKNADSYIHEKADEPDYDRDSYIYANNYYNTLH